MMDVFEMKYLNIYIIDRPITNLSHNSRSQFSRQDKHTCLCTIHTYVWDIHTYMYTRIHVCIHVLCTHVCNDVHIAMCARSLERTYLFTYIHTCMHALTMDVGLFVYCICVCR